jgi:hypothetical protein
VKSIPLLERQAVSEQVGTSLFSNRKEMYGKVCSNGNSHWHTTFSPGCKDRVMPSSGQGLEGTMKEVAKRMPIK